MSQISHRASRQAAGIKFKIKKYQRIDVHILFGNVRFMLKLAFSLHWQRVTVMHIMTLVAEVVLTTTL